MCLIIDINKHPDSKPIIAKEDMTVWKITNHLLQSAVQGYQWDIGTLHTANMRVEPGAGYPLINEGLHAYLSEEIARTSDSYMSVIKCLIPKGSEIFYDLDGTEVVSNQLKMVEIIRQGHALVIDLEDEDDFYEDDDYDYWDSPHEQ